MARADTQKCQPKNPIYRYRSIVENRFFAESTDFAAKIRDVRDDAICYTGYPTCDALFCSDGFSVDSR